MKKIYKIETPNDFKIINEAVLEQIKLSPFVIALLGDLGAGKTTFVQQLAKQLGVGEVVVSPTFVIMRRYDTTHPVFQELLHIDLYRLEEVGEAAPLRLVELMSEPGILTCIEWPERAPEIIPDKAAKVTLKIVKGNVREAELTLPPAE